MLDARTALMLDALNMPALTQDAKYRDGLIGGYCDYLIALHTRQILADERYAALNGRPNCMKDNNYKLLKHDLYDLIHRQAEVMEGIGDAEADDGLEGQDRVSCCIGHEEEVLHRFIKNLEKVLADEESNLGN